MYAASRGMNWNRFFFFSSRRRHTRYIGDWSSDVCSSDLERRLHGCDIVLVAGASDAIGEVQNGALERGHLVARGQAGDRRLQPSYFIPDGADRQGVQIGRSRARRLKPARQLGDVLIQRTQGVLIRTGRGSPGGLRGAIRWCGPERARWSAGAAVGLKFALPRTDRGDCALDLITGIKAPAADRPSRQRREALIH